VAGQLDARRTSITASKNCSSATYASIPLWHWAIPDPGTECGVTHLGPLNVDMLRDAGVASAIGLATIPLILLLARWCAATHAELAVRMLGPSAYALPRDEAAKRV